MIRVGRPRTPGALDLSQFTVDGMRKRVTCPQAQHRVGWYRAKDAKDAKDGKDGKGESVAQALFAKTVCHPCPPCSACTATRATGRSMTLRFPQARHHMLLAARQRQQTAAFQALYCRRAGIAGTCSHTTRTTGVRRARYRALPKTHLQHALTAVATNLLPTSCVWMPGCRACPSPRPVPPALPLSPLNR